LSPSRRSRAPAWPGGCSGAVSLTFDDALRSQLATAVPALDERGLRGTFYVSPNAAWHTEADAWRAVQTQGHEIGNHTVAHPCSGNFAWFGGKPLEEMNLEEIEGEIRSGQEAIRAAVPAQGDFSFCYPCYQDFVGRGEARRSYVPVVAKYHSAARGWGEGLNDPHQVDLHYIWGIPATNLTVRDMIDLCEQAADGGWAVLVFHDIGAERLPVSRRDFSRLCRHLDRRREALWTAPIAEVAAQIRALRSW
jgi:peptidoglycan/xylan/chitin deacetylase (PgdA/CDA1 family)